MGYSVERTRYGIVVRGSELPVRDLVGLSKVWSKEGLTALVPGIPGALLAVARPEDVADWRASVSSEARAEAPDDVELQWLLGPDTGDSSGTIFSVLSEDHGHQVEHLTGSEPLDADDFGRCHRLLERMPAWRARLGEVADRFPHWAPLVDHWDEITRAYLEELPTGRAPRTCALIAKLRWIRG